MKLKILIVLLILGMTLSMSTALSGCGANSGETVTVQSVSVITDSGNTGIVDKMAGKVISSHTLEIFKKSDQKVVALNVKTGDEVKKGDVLFSYDKASLKLAYEKLVLQKEQYKNLIKTINQRIDELKKTANSGNEAAKLENSIQLQTAQIELKEAEYALSGMDSQIKEASELLDKVDYVIDIDGRIQSINEDLYENSDTKPFITVVETGAFRIEGRVSEMHLSSIDIGNRVIVRSRSDKNRIWRGEITQIDLDMPETGNDQSNGMMYYGGESNSFTQISSYPFYVTLDDAEGLILGQHVYVESDVGQCDGREGLWLPSYYICDTDTVPYVWKAGNRNRLVKAYVGLGVYDRESDSYEIISGIDKDDYIAFADGSLEEGMKTEIFDESVFTDGDDGLYDLPEDDAFIDDGITVDGIDNYGAYDEPQADEPDGFVMG